jgi:hypothetical protein
MGKYYTSTNTGSSGTTPGILIFSKMKMGIVVEKNLSTAAVLAFILNT